MSSRKHKSKDRNESRASSGATQIDASVAAADGSSPAVRRQNDPRPWFLAVVTALFVARPMLPSESIAQSGEGTMLVMLSLLLLAVWSIYLLRSGGRALRFGPADAAVLVLLLLHTASALWATKTGNARAALNVLWAWVGMGVGFFLLRQLVRTAREARAIVAVMIALGVALAGYGLYQYAVEIPEMQRDFARDAEGMMRSEGLWYEPGSVAREQFDQRLKSHEPYATFALTNSLAGYLAPWLAVAVGLALFSGTNPSRDREGAVGECHEPQPLPHGRGSDCTNETPFAARTWIVVGLIVILMGGCLLLTKSRSGLLAAAFGLGLIGLVRLVQRRRVGWRLPLAGLGVAAALVAGAVAVGGLDRQMLSEASKSLGYRVQYWRSTWAMIADHPWLGCGPGQFQNAYTLYKLPEASEEIADPHNFVLEIWATAGAPALVAFLAALAYLVWSARVRTPHAPREVTSHSGNMDAQPADALYWIYAGALVGFLAAWPLGLLGITAPSLYLLYLGLPLAAVTAFLLTGWVRAGQFSMAVLLIGLVVLLVNLLAAGGIGFPGVAGTLWLLVALGLSATETSPPKILPRGVAWIVAIFAVTLAVAGYATAYRPVLNARGPMVAASFEPDRRVEYLLAAAAADPLWPEPWRNLSQLALTQWQASHADESLEHFDQCAVQLKRLNPASAPMWDLLGNQYLEIYETTGSKDRLEAARDSYRRAVALYPNEAEYHGKLALVLEQSGQASAAHREAATALRLDDAMPHQDKKLPGQLRRRLLRMESRP